VEPTRVSKTTDQDHEISREDLSQTDGEPLPEATPEPLTGPAPAAMWAALAEQVGAHGYRIERGQCWGANGYTDPAGRLVRVRADVAEAMAARVLAHELAHIECGHCDHGGYRCRGRCEVEAESVAWLISAHFGLDTGAYTLPYVAGWAHAADRASAVSEVRAAFAAVTAAHRRILTALDGGTGAGETASPDRAPHGGGRGRCDGLPRARGDL